MSLTRTEARRMARDLRRKWLKRILWTLAFAVVAGTLGRWLWNWTGTPVLLE